MMTLSGRLAGVVLALVLLPSSASGNPKPPPRTTVQEQAFSFQVPSDWFPAVFDLTTGSWLPVKGFVPGRLQPGFSLTYASPRGDFFNVTFDPVGEEPGGDIEWTVEPSGDRLTLLKEGPVCARLPPDSYGVMETCTAGDGNLVIEVIPRRLRLRGHAYSLGFGNVRREKGVDHQVFRDILASFKAK